MQSKYNPDQTMTAINPHPVVTSMRQHGFKVVA